MAREFREDDLKKPVIAPPGIMVGVIRDVERDRAIVERTEDHDSPTEELKGMLGWDDEDPDEDREIRRDHVQSYEDDAIHLRRNA